MSSPTADIIVPVWNSPVETRACLASVLANSPEARLIVIDNGSSRQNQQMLVEFFESLGEQGLFISSERNIGLVPAINIGLARSDGDFAVILRPHVTVTAGWLKELLAAAAGGIASPRFSGCGAPSVQPPVDGCSEMETCSLSFSALALKKDLHILIGGFDEQLDGGEWCLKNYVSRAWSRGFRTCVTSRATVVCANDAVLGSAARRREQALAAKAAYLQRWGASRHYAVYFGCETEADSLAGTVQTILEGARQGHRFTLLLHRRQASAFRRMGWNGLHTSIELRTLSALMPQRDLRRNLAALRGESAGLLPVLGAAGTHFPGADAAIAFSDVEAAIDRHRSLHSDPQGKTIPEAAS